MWIDSHCHLNHERIRPLGSPAEIINAARLEGVEAMLSVCCRISDEFPGLLKIAQDHESVWCSIGTHPHDAGDPDEKAVTLEKLVELARSDPNIIGIGESGLDYYYDHSPRDEQQESFRKHIRACLKTGLPLIVHTRDAEEDTMRIVEEEASPGALKGVMHCFSGSRALAEWALDFGFYISFSGIVTFKKAKELQEIAKTVPLARTLIETDAPFLAPEPHRGKINQPAYVRNTGSYLAKLHSISIENMANHSKQNFFSLFSKAKPV